MSYNDLLRNLRFERDPFAKTNADEEDLLENYFIEPPFFKAVYGDISDPKSAIVYAPRGGGKTALKRRIELPGANISRYPAAAAPESWPVFHVRWYRNRVDHEQRAANCPGGVPCVGT